MTIQIPRLTSGGLITNYSCTSRCRHCLYNCGPHRSKKYITSDQARTILKTVAQRGAASVHVGGGEPLLNPSALGAVLQAATEAGVAVDYVETNSSWYTDAESAVERLTGLRRKGLRTLLISISPFHNEFIPYDRVRGVIDAARQAGIGLFPWVPAFVGPLTKLDTSRAHSWQELEAVLGRDALLTIRKKYWVHLGGRALETYRRHLAATSLASLMSGQAGHCALELTDTSHFHADLYGKYIPGLCTGLAIDLKDLGQPLDDTRYPLITMLASAGVAGLLEMARNRFGFRAGRRGYINKCDLCNEVRCFLFETAREDFSELHPQGFYHQDRPNPKP